MNHRTMHYDKDIFISEFHILIEPLTSPSLFLANEMVGCYGDCDLHKSHDFYLPVVHLFHNLILISKCRTKAGLAVILFWVLECVV